MTKLVNRYGILTGVAATVFATPAFTGGIDASRQPIEPLFERGSYFELAAVGLGPNVSGVDFTGQSSGNAGKFLTLLSFAYKANINDKLSFAIIGDQPFRALIDYDKGAFAGVSGDVNTYAITGLLRYKITDVFSVYGGPRLQEFSFGATGPSYTGYSVDTNGYHWALGYSVGMAYENRGMRLALTYNSETNYEYTSTESGVNGTMKQQLPMSVNLSGQFPINQETLLFGSARWVNWAGFQVAPPEFYMQNGRALISLVSDTVTFNVGLGRKFTDMWSGAVIVGYEPSEEKPISFFTPVNGFWNIGANVTAAVNSSKITFGVTYGSLGPLGNENDIIRFSGGSAIVLSTKLSTNW